jgi:hypothetical protein
MFDDGLYSTIQCRMAAINKINRLFEPDSVFLNLNAEVKKGFIKSGRV